MCCFYECEYIQFSLQISHSLDSMYVWYASKIMKHFLKFVLCFLIRKRATLLWFASGFVREALGYGIVTLFAKRSAIQRTRRIFTTKVVAIQELRRFTRRRTAARPSKCGTFGGRKAVHVPPCFQVPLRHVCFILCDAYRMYGWM